MPKLHVFHTGCDELVRKVGIYFDNKYLVLASPEKQVLCHNKCREKFVLFISSFIYYITFVHFIFKETKLTHYISGRNDTSM